MIAKPIRPSRRRKAALMDACKAVGCTCTPDLTVTHWYSDDFQHHRALHDDDCPAADAGRTLTIHPATKP
jgi:hypothetical protein